MLLLDAIDLVEEIGFTAYGARSADEALLLLERHADIRVLFTDIDMPGSINGLALAHAVRERWPPLVIILTSGLHLITAENMPADGLFFSKPYRPDVIIEAVRAAAATAR